MQLPSVLEHPLLYQNQLLLIIVIIATIPLSTYALSSFLFHRTARINSSGKTPPTVPYSIPGLYHVFALLTQGPPKFFANIINTYGRLAPFVVRAGPLSFLVVRDANHVKKIFQSSKTLTPTALHVQVFDKVMGSPKEVLEIYGAVGSGRTDSEQVDYAHLTVPRLHLVGTSLTSIAEVYIAILRRNLAKKRFNVERWVEIQDLWSFFQVEITRATMETLFGSVILEDYPDLVQDFWKFDSNIENFTRGLPRFMIPSAWAARDRLRQKIKKWLQSVHEGDDFAKLGEEDPSWDQNMGSKFFQHRDSVLAKIAGMNDDARASEAMAIMQGSNSNTMPSTFWYIFETLRNPDLVMHLTSEVEKRYDANSGSYDFAALSGIPILQSMHTEIGRLRMATGAIRTNEGGLFKLDENWVIPKGTSVMIFSHDLAMNTELWSRARPRTVERPLEDFWAERFLIPEKLSRDQPKTVEVSRIGSGRFSMEGIGALHVTFGGGHHLCPGRHFAKAVQISTLSVLLSEYEMELCNVGAAERQIPPVRRAAYGTVRPLGNIPVRIRRRDRGKE
ncbi:cytochrome P450 [Lindgomyces ingoldianus]|uniref:Cytochrome P450 n=1 Tax=Lindgomyces ingoldianus TaxID=673940 RepID=A0ACB6R8Y1_9PLEO|nr:cytochrome P450 [Lindgomyces ingoldianus]KAF2475223.1 cytochrome P450 [Lindgomyces ingoldianus]